MRKIKGPVLAVAAALLLWLPTASAGEACKDDESVSEETKGDCQDEAEEEPDTDWFPGSLSGSATIITDYSFRGVSQTDRDTALQGSIGWSHDSGFYVGTWGSSVTLNDAFLEQDFYAGFANSVGNFSYDLSLVFFYYPQEHDFNYFEIVGKTAYDFGFLTTKLGLVVSPDISGGYFGTQGTGFYVPFGLAVPIPEDIKYFDMTVDGNAGYTNTEIDIFEDCYYWDWNVGLNVALPVGLSFDFRYVDTDVKNVHDAGARFIFGTTYAF
jgi:uncharacterized protein (TIGR02001 family)